MPSTVNGIGTTYYGHANAQSRMGVCRSCGHTGRLESYDTRLWFVIIFIPVIPLGRKRIIDQCPHCQRHYVANKDQYEMSRQLGISAAQEQFREHPTPESALEVHATLLAYHDHEGAAAFSEEALKRFPNSGELCVGLASHMEQVGRYADAEKFYEKAWELRPDLPQVRDAQARKKIAENKLDEARELLNFLMHPGAGQTYSFGTLDQLAYAYQKQGRHEESLEMCQHLLGEFPAVGQEHQFRKFVQTSEKAVGRPDSILPRVQGGWLSLLNYKSTVHAPWKKWTAITTVISVLVLGGLFFNNEYKRRHQTIHVVNAFPAAAMIQVDAEKPVPIMGRGTLTMAEGPHHIKVTGPIQEELDIRPESTFFDRWTKSPAWVLNVGGRATLREWTITYAPNPPPAIARLFVNDKFVAIPHVDYIFKDVPEKIQVKNQQQVIKTQLDTADESPSSVFMELSRTQGDKALNFAEIQLGYQPDDVRLMSSYIDFGLSQNKLDRIEKYLNAGRDRRPIDVNWHRFYQNLLERTKRLDQVMAEYTKLLEASPNDGTLLYLCGRLEPDDAKAEDLLKRSTVADDTLPWAWYALASRSAVAGNWTAAATQIEKSRERKMDPLQLGALRHTILIGNGEIDKLEAEYRELLKTNPTDFYTILRLCDVLAVQGKPEAAQATLTGLENSVPAAQRFGEVATALAMFRETVNYQLGSWPNANGQPPLANIYPVGATIRAETLMATGQAEIAAKDPQLTETFKDGWMALGLSISYGLSGHAAEAAEWREKACKLLDEGNEDARVPVKLLRMETAPPIEEVRTATHQVSEQLRVLGALAQKFPDSATIYGEEIAKLNVSRFPPYQLVKQLAKPPAAK